MSPEFFLRETTERSVPQFSNLNLPRHIGIIMDGNGRWAKARSMPRTFGHREGLEAAKRIVRAARELGVEYLSLYTFSTENWKRAADEVGFLMDLIRRHLRNEYDFYRENQIRVLHSGDLAQLPANVREEIRRVMEDTAGFSGLTVNLAINYGGRDEILRGVKGLIRDLVHKKSSPQAIAQAIADLSEDDLAGYMDLPGLPDTDLIIRTGGEQRISNFMIWRGAYSEFVFSERLWPDWDIEDLKLAIAEYQQRNRRFGGINKEPGDNA